MIGKQNASKVLDELHSLLENYGNVYRMENISSRVDYYEKYSDLSRSEIDCDNELVRESLSEHVGHLPIAASFLHQYMENRDEIDLGNALLMLSIHDIGETKEGDIPFYEKTESDGDKEFNTALKLIPDYLHQYYKEVENPITTTGQFAKAIDKIIPNIIESNQYPELTKKRYEGHGHNPKDFFERKRKYFEFSPFLLDLLKEAIKRTESKIA